MKRFEILYNPYYNHIHFRQGLAVEDSDKVEWQEIEPDSQLLKFQRTRCIFENCVEEILDLVNKYFNTSGELTIDFIGTDVDFGVLRLAVERSQNPKSKGITCEISERYPASSDVLQKIREAYEEIKSEFDDYIENAELAEDDDRAVIGRAVTKFLETVETEIPVCVIGNYSVGKSALVNALVGLEILPSHANSTTAKNVLLKNGRAYSMCFSYKNEEYTLLIHENGIEPHCENNIDQNLIDQLTKGTDVLNTEEQILHQIIENLNTETGVESRIAEIDSSVKVTVPFKNSELDTDKYSFVFIDTPGSNNGDEAQRIHRENLEELMDEQTNALPIFVMGRNSLDSNDANDLRVLLENKEAGFALQNCIIAISMSDQLVEQQLSEELPEKIKRWMNHPTIMYVSPIAAIGEKKEDKSIWIDQAYRQIYEKKMGDLSEVNPPLYNETHCGRKISDARKSSIAPLLYASGVPSLETEINYYANRFAEFKKCTNGRAYLVTALETADKKLQEAKIQVENDKKDKIREQDEIRAEIIQKIDGVPLPPVNSVIDAVYGEFTEVLDNFCMGIEPLVQETWEDCQNMGNDIDLFEKRIAEYCQKNLYDAHAKEIKARIEERFVKLTDTYMDEVKKCVTDEYSKISGEAQKELEQVFATNENGPQFKEVSFDFFERIKFNVLGRLPLNRAKEMFVEQYARRLRTHLKGNSEIIGSFAMQCIAMPARKYSQQISDWSEGYRQSIDATLKSENAILSSLDEKIKQLEERIEDMERRLKNLSNVKIVLQHVFPDSPEA